MAGHERRRRPVRLRQDVPAAGGQERARDEESGGLPAAVHGSGEGRLRQPPGPGPHPAWPRSKATCTTSARTSSAWCSAATTTRSSTWASWCPCEKILQTAREKNVDIIGLSGLITPSLDEMVHVAKEMERQGFSLPLLIGGATTSKAHTAVKIAPAYSQPVVHVLDASRAVGVVSSLLNPDLKPAFVESVRAEYDKLRAQHAGQTAKPLLTIEEARRRRTPIDWTAERHRQARVHRRPRPDLRSRNAQPRDSSIAHHPCRPRAVHRLVAVLPHLGAARALPGHPGEPRRRSEALRRCAGTAATRSSPGSC